MLEEFLGFVVVSPSFLEIIKQGRIDKRSAIMSALLGGEHLPIRNS